MLRKTPGFSLLVIFTLALGIGANTAVFSVIYAVLIKPLPYPDAGHIVALYEIKTAHDNTSQAYVAPGNFLDWRDQNRSFSAIAGFVNFHYILTGEGGPEHLWGGAVSAGWWNVFGIRPEVGRVFSAGEDRPDAPEVVVLTDRLWRTRFHAEPQIIGRTILLNGNSYTVLGVMPPDPTSFHTYIDFWTPLERQILPERMRWRDSRFVMTFARLRPGVSIEQATDDLNRISASIKGEYASADVYGGAAVAPLRQFLTGDTRRELLVAFAIVGLLLLVACTNVANLMLARMSGRTRELAIRTALGAKPLQVLRQFFIESLCLSLAAGLAGIGFAETFTGIIRHFGEAQLTELAFARINIYVIAFTFVLSAGTAAAFGLLPAIAVLRSDTEDVLRTASVTVTSHRSRQRLRHGIAIAEIACSLVLLAAAGLLLRSLIALERSPLGFATDYRAIVFIALPRMKYQQDRDLIRFYNNVVERVRTIPGIEDAGIIQPHPLHEDRFATSIVISGEAPNQYEPVALRLTDGHYFTVLKIPMLRGRGFTDHDDIDSPPVCIISKGMAHYYWPHQDPIGKFVTLTRQDAAGTNRPRQIVGVVADIRDEINLQPEPTVYVPYRQVPFPSMQLAIHTALPIGSLKPLIESAVQTVDSEEPLGPILSLDSVVAEAQRPWRLALSLLGSLAALALLLSAVGVFGVMSYLVREKTKEFGIRAALGAAPRDIGRGVLGAAAIIGLVGVALGVAISVMVTRFLGSLIYGIPPADPVTFAAAAALLTGVALLASYIPARSATRIDPVIALRYE